MKTKKLITILLTFFLCHTVVFADAVQNKKPSEQDESDLNLTDQERHTSQNYLHEGLIDKKVEEGCEKIGEGACDGRGKTEFMGVDSEMVKMIAQAYTMVMGLVGGTGDMKLKEPNAEGEETATDYCKYIPMVTETMGMFMQKSEQQNLGNVPESQESAQADLLYKAARSHETRAKTAQIQATGFTATTACYVYYATMGGVVTDWKLWAKMAASGLLAWFYWEESDAQKKHAKDVREIADNLPGKGECNPVTDTDCFCSHEESKKDATNYQQYCIPNLHNNKVADTSYEVPCVDANTSVDAKCTCISQDSCFDKKYFSDINMPGFGEFLKTPAAKDFASMTRGELKSGRLSGIGAKKGARSNRLLKDALKKLGPPSGLNPLGSTQQGGFDAIAKTGFPKPLAHLIAGSKSGPKFRSNFNRFRGRYAKRPSSKSKYRRSNVMRFSKASGLNLNRRKKGGSSNPYAGLLRGKRRKGKAKGSKVLHYKKAMKAADINKDTSRSIFEVISRRYLQSGRNRLGID